MEVVKLRNSAEFIDRVIDNNASDYNIVLNPIGDYREWVIPLVEMDHEYSNFYGEVLIARNNSIYPATRVILGMSKPWQLSQCRCNNLVVYTVEPNVCSLCYFNYNGTRYCGIRWVGVSYPDIVRFRIMYSQFDPEIIFYKTLEDGIVNQEIADSIVKVNWDGTLLE